MHRVNVVQVAVELGKFQTVGAESNELNVWMRLDEKSKSEDQNMIMKVFDIQN